MTKLKHFQLGVFCWARVAVAKVFDYKIVEGPKRFKLKPEAPKDLLEVKKLMTPTEAKKVLTEGQFKECFDEEQTVKLTIGGER